MADLHFLRPLWLVGVALAPLLAWLLWRRREAGEWGRACDAHLLRFLAASGAARARAMRFGLAGLTGALAGLALAGPSWDVEDVPVFRALTARVVVLDVSRSMDARDIAPSRMAVARDKAARLLQRTGERQAGLVVFAGDGSAITPLTSDAASLIGILPAFDTRVAPVQGSRPDRGLEEAALLIRRSAPGGGDIVLITDGAKGRRAVEVAGQLRARGMRVSVLAVGTAGGATIPLAGGAPLRGLDGETVIAHTPLELLEDIARAGGGRFAVVTPDDADIEHILAAPVVETDEPGVDTVDQRAKIWLDGGPYFALALLPLAAAGWRRGWIAGVVLACVLVPAAPPAFASEHQAAPSSKGWRWRAVELYRNGRYLAAASLFANGDHADDHYNRGNALALAGYSLAALAAYAEAISREEMHEDALFNRDVLRARMQSEAGEGDGDGTVAGDAETSGAGGSGGDGAGQSGSADTRARDAPDRDPAEQESDSADEPDDAGVPAGQALAAEEDDEGSLDAPEVLGSELSPEELESLEETLSHLARDRLTLWRRKLAIEWRQPRGGPPDRTNAW